MERQIPTVTLDRSLAHFVSKLDLDLDRIADFYEELPFPNKPSLAECRIHISSLLVQRGTTAVAGAMARRKWVEEYDPLAPPDTDILRFLGSVNAIGITLAEAIGHELAHYADPAELPKKTPEVLNKESQVWFYRSGLQTLFTLGAQLVLLTSVWLIAGLATDRGLRLTDWLLVLALSVVLMLLGSQRRRRRIHRLERELHETYESLEGEQVAFKLADLQEGAVTITMRANPKKPVYRPGIGHRRQNQIADAAHRQMCLRPPRTLPAAAATTSLKSVVIQQFHALPRGRLSQTARVAGRDPFRVAFRLKPTLTLPSLAYGSNCRSMGTSTVKKRSRPSSNGPMIISSTTTWNTRPTKRTRQAG